MKTFYSVIFLSFLIIFPLVTSVNGNDDWVIYETSYEGDVYSYSKVSIKPKTKDIVQVWSKLVYSDKSRVEVIQKLMENGLFTKTELEKLSYNVILQEIVCKEKKSRTVSIRYYDKDSNVLYSSAVEKIIWTYIIPDTVTDILRKKVCK